MKTVSLLFETARPKQWIKNAFVLAALVFSGDLFNADYQLYSWLAVAAFCMASSATYLLNDALDAETDRQNPRTANRPIARGDLSVATAFTFSGLLAGGGLALAFIANWQTLLVVGVYFVMQLLYSKWLKHVLFLDVMVIASGFVLRVLAGGTATGVHLSEWLIICTGLLALFLGLGKRRGEAIALGGGSHPQRPVLEHYSLKLLDELISVITPATLVAYVIYTAIGAESRWMMLTIPFVIYGIFRVLYLIHYDADSGQSEDPSNLATRDLPLVICLVLWVTAAGFVTVINP